jgi:cell division protein FtsQ
VTIAALAVDARGAWTATLADGLQLRLGRTDVEQRMRRFVDFALARPAAKKALATAGYVDLRYSDGFAVGGSRATHPAKTHQEKMDEQTA